MEGAVAEDGRSASIWDTFTHSGEQEHFRLLKLIYFKGNAFVFNILQEKRSSIAPET